MQQEHKGRYANLCERKLWGNLWEIIRNIIKLRKKEYTLNMSVNRKMAFIGVGTNLAKGSETCFESRTMR